MSRMLVFLAVLAGLSMPAAAQPPGPRGGDAFKFGKGAPGGTEDRRREPGPGWDPRRERDFRDGRPERMRPEDREKLRQDIDDANRQMGRRR